MKNEFVSDFNWFYKKVKKPLFIWYAFLGSMVVIFFLHLLLRGFNYCFVELPKIKQLEYYSIEKYLEEGRSAGTDDGRADWRKYIKLQPGGKIPTSYTKLGDTPWEKYKLELKEYKSLAQSEKEEYLSQFEDSDRSRKLAEFRLEGEKFPSEKKLENVFGIAKDFYIDYVNKKIKRENYASEDEYVKARRKEAWRVGYEYEYAIEVSRGSPTSQWNRRF